MVLLSRVDKSLCPRGISCGKQFTSPPLFMIVCCLPGFLFPVLPEGWCDKAGLAAQSKCQQHHHCYHEGGSGAGTHERGMRWSSSHISKAPRSSGWVWVWVWVWMGICPLVSHGGLENPVWKQFWPSPPQRVSWSRWTMTGKRTKKVKHVLGKQDRFLDEHLRPRRGNSCPAKTAFWIDHFLAGWKYVERPALK